MSTNKGVKVKAFEYDQSTNELTILDQKQLPNAIVFIKIKTTDESRDHILKMTVRGAPCIAAVYLLSMVAELNHIDTIVNFEDLVSFHELCKKKIYYVRPTAVNLYNALSKLRSYLEELRSMPGSIQDKIRDITNYCLRGIESGTKCNECIGKFGSDKLISDLMVEGRSDGLNILTHCNTGSLATTGYGTALGVIRSLHESKALSHVYCTETRPYNQGSRLTAWELVQEKIPATLICDSAVAFLMKQRPIDAIIVGADCVAKNGDTANKIGTLQLAVMARYNNIPFYVAAPLQTIDLDKESGNCIMVECRSSSELRNVGDVVLAPKEIDVWNPSFDVTPASLITGIITECGVFIPKHIKDVKSKASDEVNSSLY